MRRHGGPDERAWRAARAVAILTATACAIALVYLLPLVGVLGVLVLAVFAPTVSLGAMVAVEATLRRVLAPGRSILALRRAG